MSFLEDQRTGWGSWLFATVASLAAHAVLALALLGSYARLLDAAEPPLERPDIIITLDRLDNFTLAGIVEQEGVIGAEGETEDAAPAEEVLPGDADTEEVLAEDAPTDDLPAEAEVEADGGEALAAEEATDIDAAEGDLAEADPEAVETPEVDADEPDLAALSESDLPDAPTVLPDEALDADAPDAVPETDETAELEADTNVTPEPEAEEIAPEDATATAAPQQLAEDAAASDDAPDAAPVPEPASEEDVASAARDAAPVPLIAEPAPETPLSPVSPLGTGGAVLSAPGAPAASAAGSPAAGTAPEAGLSAEIAALTPESEAPGEDVAQSVALEPLPDVPTPESAAEPPAPGDTALDAEEAGDEIAAVAPEPEPDPEPETGESGAGSGAPPARATPRRAPQPLSQQDIALGGLIERLRRAGGDECLLALPRRDGADGVGIALISATDAAMQSFVAEVLTQPDDAAMRQTRTLVDPRQCPALSYVRRNIEYPATRLGLRIDTPDVASGQTLEGTVAGVAGRDLTLLLIDNNGVVQDLERFVSISENYARFEVPVTRVGSLRDTKQVIVAIATREESDTLAARSGQRAQEVFANLTGEIGGRAALAIATFDVR